MSEFGPVQSKNDSGFIIGLLGLILAVGGLMYADEQTRLARVQTMHAEEQTRLAKIARDEAEEQARKKLRDVRFVPDVCYIRSSDGPWRWITFTLINSGEVDLDPNEFEVGPLIEFENPVIADYKVNTYGLPGRVKKDQNRVTLFFEAQFRTTDRVILNVLCKGEPGQIKYISRIRNGRYKAIDLEVQFLREMIMISPTTIDSSPAPPGYRFQHGPP